MCSSDLLRASGDDLGGGSETIIYENHANDPRIASGKTVFPTLCSSMGSKQWLGNQEAFSEDYHILEDT